MAHIAARRTVASFLTRTLSSSRSRSRFALALLDKNPLQPELVHDAVRIPARFKNSGPGYSHLNDPSPNCRNRPTKKSILLDGCDYEHWLIVMEFPKDPKPTEEEMIDAYVKTLASVVGRHGVNSGFLPCFVFVETELSLKKKFGLFCCSEEEAKKKIYSVCTTTYTGFGALVSEELSFKAKGI